MDEYDRPRHTVLTDHAITRASQRNMSLEDIELVIAYGDRSYRAGVIFCFLARKCLPEELRHDDQITRLIGTTVVLCSKDTHVVITLYRNERANKRDRAKSKYDRFRRRHDDRYYFYN